MQKLRLFSMMALQLAIWGAWAPKLFPYMGMLGFSAGQQALVGSCWGIASVVGIFFANQFADRYFAAERFLAVSHVIGAICLFGAAFSTQFLPFFLFYLAYSLVYVPTLSVSNTIAFAALKEGKDFGTVRAGERSAGSWPAGPSSSSLAPIPPPWTCGRSSSSRRSSRWCWPLSR
jgi:hypothetical protein